MAFKIGAHLEEILDLVGSPGADYELATRLAGEVAFGGQRVQDFGDGGRAAFVEFAKLALGDDLARQIARRQHPESEFEEHVFSK